MVAPAYNARDPDQIIYMDGARDAVTDLRRNASNASTRSLPILPNRTLPPVTSSLAGPAVPLGSKPPPQVLRKPAPPPIPNKKPSLLSKASSSGGMPAAEMYRDDPDTRLYEPRRSVPIERNSAAPGTGRKPLPNLIDGDEKPPALPPRTGTGLSGGGRSVGGARNLLDDEGDMKVMDGWEVLRPDR